MHRPTLVKIQIFDKCFHSAMFRFPFNKAEEKAVYEKWDLCDPDCGIFIRLVNGRLFSCCCSDVAVVRIHFTFCRFLLLIVEAE